MPFDSSLRARRRTWLALALFAGVAATGVRADAIKPADVLQIRWLESSAAEIRIDGVVDEPIWAGIRAFDDFVVLEPDTLERGPHATLIRFMNTERGLYVAAVMEQPPETLIKRLSGRDIRELNRDSINLTIDPTGEGRYAYWFGINLGDSLMDGTALPERQFSNEWDGPWRGASAITDTGWSAEFFIPWGMVAMPRAGDTRRMGVYLSRKVAYLDERWGWPALPNTRPRFMSALHQIEMQGVAPRQEYSVYPFTAVTYDKIDEETTYRAGADVFWRPSSNFQINATINPDFGSVESDEVIVNLTATETFFPEKRLFFVEGQEVFVASPRADTGGGGGVGRTGATNHHAEHTADRRRAARTGNAGRRHGVGPRADPTGGPVGCGQDHRPGRAHAVRGAQRVRKRGQVRCCGRRRP